ncbi:MAG: methyltransferase [Spirochaetaceae bacterium]|nr:MAG: methyltransferase [Spirochaetaceae bacterium]
MTGRERIRTALAHRQPDRVPLDFGGCNQTTVHVGVIAQLRDHFGLDKRPVKVEEPYTMMGRLDEDLKAAMEVDVDALLGLSTFFGVTRDEWKDYTMEDGLQVLVPKQFNVTRDREGKIYAYPEGDTSAPPSGVMPKRGYYFDAIIRQDPLPASDDDLKLEDNLEEFTEIPEVELQFMASQLAENRKSRRALFGVVPGAGLGDIACVPAPWMKHPRGIRDITEWYISTATRREFLHRLFDRQTDIVIHNLEKIRTVIGDEMDVAWVCGTDFGTQSSTFCSPETYTELYQPYYLKVNNWIHKHTRWKTFKHCCGSITTLMEGFIASGFDIINPVQWTAANMDMKMLKERFGKRIVFWGGGVDTQKTLPFGTPEQVREEVLRACEVFAPGGGFVFNTVHNIQAKTPIENVIAMLEAVAEFNG